MYHCSALLADLRKATGTPGELESRRKPSFLDAKALQSHIRVPTRAFLVSNNAMDGGVGSAPASRLPIKAPGSSRASGMLSAAQKSLEERLAQDLVALARKGSATARDRWRNKGAIFPERPSFLAPSMPPGQPSAVRANAPLLHMLALLGGAESTQEGVSHPALFAVQSFGCQDYHVTT